MRTPAEPVLAPSGRVDQRFDIGGTVFRYKEEEEEEEDNFGQSLSRRKKMKPNALKERQRLETREP